jgi:hypothetical protein
MKSKRTGTKRRSKSRVKTRASLQVLATRAKAEVARLLKRNREGTITRRALQTGLKEIKDDMTRILVFKKALL